MEPEFESLFSVSLREQAKSDIERFAKFHSWYKHLSYEGEDFLIFPWKYPELKSAEEYAAVEYTRQICVAVSTAKTIYNLMKRVSTPAMIYLSATALRVRRPSPQRRLYIYPRTCRPDSISSAASTVRSLRSSAPTVNTEVGKEEVHSRDSPSEYGGYSSGKRSHLSSSSPETQDQIQPRTPTPSESGRRVINQFGMSLILWSKMRERPEDLFRRPYNSDDGPGLSVSIVFDNRVCRGGLDSQIRLDYIAIPLAIPKRDDLSNVRFLFSGRDRNYSVPFSILLDCPERLLSNRHFVTFGLHNSRFYHSSR